MDKKGKYWNGEPNAILMRKEIAHLNQELEKERSRIALLATLAKRSVTGVTIFYEPADGIDSRGDGVSGYKLIERRKVHKKMNSIGFAIDAANTDSLA